MQKVLRVDFVRFAMVGSLGFAINFALLTLLFKFLGWPLFIAQVISAEIALAHNFIWHHHWTYKGHESSKSIGKLIVEFHITSWVAIVGSALLVSLFVHAFNMDYTIALVFSSAIGMLWNFAWTKMAIWKRAQET